MPDAYDDLFKHDPQADLAYERDWTNWLGSATLTVVTWVIENASLLDKHDESILASNKIARVWLLGKGVVGNTKVTCRVTASDGRKDDRSWMICVLER